MSLHKLSNTAFREALSLAVNNTLDDTEMVERVSVYGYTQEVLDAVKAQLDTFTDAKAYKHARYGFQRAATSALRGARESFHRGTYMPHVTLARVVFKNDPGVQTKLGLNNRRESRFSAWLNQVRQFYTNALAVEEVKDRLAARGVTEQMLTEALEQANHIGQLHHLRESKRGLAQQSTADRNTLRTDLADWLSDYHRIARLAFADRPEWLERIGVLHRSA